MHLPLHREMMISALVFCMVNVALALNYNELQELGVSCPPRDSCRNRSGTDWMPSHTCDCRLSCMEKGTCCIDSPYVNVNRQRATQKCISLNERHVSCRHSQGIWIVIKCSPGWAGSSAVKEFCEGDALRLGNFLMLVLAYNPVSGKTYSNYFCAVCNYDDKDVRLPYVKLKSDRNRDFLEPCQEHDNMDLEYNRTIGSWGYRSNFADGKSMFIPVSFETGDVSGEFCRRGIVWRCPPSWEDDTVRKKCEAYMAVVRGPVGYDIKVFRNVHCAICNNVFDFTDFVCERYYVPPIETCGFPPAVDHTIVNLLALDVNFMQCGERNQTYNSDFKGCKPTIFRNGK